jgi:hypothetical protein
MRAKIATEKVLIRGQKCRKVVGFEGIARRDSLPKKYMVGGPRFWLAEYANQATTYDGEAYVRPCGGCAESALNLDQGTGMLFLEIPRRGNPDIPGYHGSNEIELRLAGRCVLLEEDFQNVLLWMRRAGGRLGKINRELAEENEKWHGTETHTI